MARGWRNVEVKSWKTTANIGNDTEVEITLPLVPDVGTIGGKFYGEGDERFILLKLRQYYNRYTIPKSLTDFDFRI